MVINLIRITKAEYDKIKESMRWTGTPIYELYECKTFNKIMYFKSMI